ncbi:hypothetical protein LOD99_7505 [Oopsacas minuta]|uniref:Uncharacterized protein n=1 Tax=Oopsacas minuta TaxID=111878 RepID=A0AAV7JUA8_9METZ|nr:hypothetical protein LOD99_7505 [Oopsacas minuta]
MERKYLNRIFPKLVTQLTDNCGYQYLITARIQDDPHEHHFGLYRQMSGCHYEISFNQILESECRLQLLNLLKVSNLKYSSASSSTEGIISRKEYLNKFDYDYECINQEQLDIEHYLTKLSEISLPEIEVSQIEYLVHIAGYAVFSYIKKSNGCQFCQGLLTSDKLLEVNNDIRSHYTQCGII